MCYLVVEKYSVCRCIYYQHNIDMCAAYGTPIHNKRHHHHLVDIRIRDMELQVMGHIDTPLDDTAGETYCLRLLDTFGIRDR
ncbi:hypothetical protein HYFRA_00007488 [Hymenoscyphus fraxineus]|uniref:Uncharacterized protein n=1 Tax=Hymenoscyphus fraxineus TaxID=746836 RepID=A0A9N9KT71_9HELO|nr:hypothetical protein HYFRA_00007488 [Hymenoscyphus fraxineus]